MTFANGINASSRHAANGNGQSSEGDFLVVKGKHITLHGAPILLKGAGLGGWMMMENFITGFTGHEFQLREAMRDVLGAEKYAFFFDKFLEYFFTEDDAKFFASLGLNCIRLPVNYRHFEDDLNPRVFKKDGLKHLDRVIDLCSKYGIYTVIDLHAAPGGQNVDWHSDAGSHQALFWEHKDFQDRTILIWEHLARHYKNNTWVAGYNPLNEPTDSKHVRLLAFYERVAEAIRKIDPDHILFLDGNTFGYDFSHFGEPLPNAVYACHDYSRYGFPNPPSEFAGTPEQLAWHERSFHRKVEYMLKHEASGLYVPHSSHLIVQIPIWNGEFGPVYQNANDGLPDWEEINDRRYEVLKYQLGMYARDQAGWSIWLYKDIGFQGMVYVDENTPYLQLIKPFLEKKKRYATDEWGCDDKPVRELFRPIEEWITEAAPGIKNRYPPTWKPTIHVGRLMRNILLSEELCLEFAELFRGKNTEELEALAASFSYKHCNQRQRLNTILTEDSKRAI